VTYARRESKAEKKERKRGLRFRVHSESAVATGSCSRNPPATTAASLCQLEVLRLPSLHHQKTRGSEDQETLEKTKRPEVSANCPREPLNLLSIIDVASTLGQRPMTTS